MTGDLIQPRHLIIFAGIVLIAFGPIIIPELLSSIGRTIKDFKKIMDKPQKKSRELSEVEKIELRKR
jgi:TatA/E family protein of Tat protein translocase